VRCLRDWGQTQRYHHDLLGFNYRMDGLQGAFLRVKLRKLEEWTEGRRAAAARYEQLLAGLPVGRPVEASERRHVYHVYAIRTARRAEAQDRLNRAQIGNGIHYPIPVHLQKCLSYLGHRPGDFPVTEAASNEVLSLPMYPELAEASQVTVRDTLAAALG